MPGLRPGVRGLARGGRPVPHAGHPGPAVLRAAAGPGPGFLPAGPAAAGRPGRRLADAGRVPAGRPLPGLLHRPLRDPAGRRGLVLLTRRGAGLPRGLPVPVPRPPRHALGPPGGGLADGGRRLPDLRRPDRQGPVQRAGGHPGAGRSARARQRRGARRQRRPRQVPLRGHRHPPRPGAAAARPAHPGRARGPRRVPLPVQRGRAAHRRRPAAAGRAGPGVLELPARRLRGRRRAGARQLLPEPPAPAGRPAPTTWSRSTPWTRSRPAPSSTG